jgi:hypothetical protein
MSGTASPINLTFLKRSGSTYSEIPGVPIPSSLNYSVDVRQFSGAFDFEVALANGEEFSPKSHDAVEISTEIDGVQQQLGVGFIEDLVDDSDERHSSLKANGRDLIGQLVALPFITHLTYKDQDIQTFARFSIQDTYLKDYLAFRGRTNPVVDQGAYKLPLLVVTMNSHKRAAVLQNYAELAMNLIYQNPNGQVEIYGRQTGTNPIGTLSRAPGRTNVNHIRLSNGFSKVVSECTIEWTAGQEHVDRDKLNSTRVKNTDPRVAHIFQPETRVFSASDLQALAGQQDADFRVESLAKSVVRKSMANVGAVVIVTSEPFFTDETGKKTVFRVMQAWQIEDPRERHRQGYATGRHLLHPGCGAIECPVILRGARHPGMRLPTGDDIKRIVLQAVQPMASGVIDTVANFTAKLTDVSGFGSGDQFKTSFPYGMVSKPIKGVKAYFLNLGGSILAPIIISHLDNKRPVPSTAGEVILYCLSADGSAVPVKLTLGVNGVLKIETTSKVQVLADSVEIGNGALEKILNGETFQARFNGHQHVVLGATSSPPVSQSPAGDLSGKVKAAK